MFLKMFKQKKRTIPPEFTKGEHIQVVVGSGRFWGD